LLVSPIALVLLSGCAPLLLDFRATGNAALIGKRSGVLESTGWTLDGLRAGHKVPQHETPPHYQSFGASDISGFGNDDSPTKEPWQLQLVEYSVASISPMTSAPEPENPSNSASGPDPELVDLPAPRRPWRRVTLFVLSLTALGSLAMIVGLMGELRYAVGSSTPTEVGDIGNLSPKAGTSNRFIHGTGEIAPIGAIRYARPLERDAFRLAPLVGNPKVWIELRIPTDYDNEHFVPPNSFAGRLIRMDSGGLRHSILREAAHSGWGPAHIPDGAWVLIDGESPQSTRWALGLCSLFLTFAGFCLWALYSLLRPVKSI
jgi:hypothetical protein